MFPKDFHVNYCQFWRPFGIESYCALQFYLLPGKLVFAELTLSLRASSQTGVAIPRLKGTGNDYYQTTQRFPALQGYYRYISPLTGGLPRPLKRTGLAMTGNRGMARQTQISAERTGHFSGNMGWWLQSGEKDGKIAERSEKDVTDYG